MKKYIKPEMQEIDLLVESPLLTASDCLIPPIKEEEADPDLEVLSEKRSSDFWE